MTSHDSSFAPRSAEITLCTWSQTSRVVRGVRSSSPALARLVRRCTSVMPGAATAAASSFHVRHGDEHGTLAAIAGGVCGATRRAAPGDGGGLWTGDSIPSASASACSCAEWLQPLEMSSAMPVSPMSLLCGAAATRSALGTICRAGVCWGGGLSENGSERCAEGGMVAAWFESGTGESDGVEAGDEGARASDVGALVPVPA